MIIDCVIQPFGGFDALKLVRHEGRIGPSCFGQSVEILFGLMDAIIAQEAFIDRGAIAGAAGPRIIANIAILAPESWAACHFRIVAFAVIDNVRSVIGDDVHIDFHPAGMGGVDKSLEIVARANVWIDIGEISDPIAVIARRLEPFWALHRIVLKNRRQPNRCHAEPLDIVQALGQAFQVAAMIEAVIGRVIPIFQAAAFNAAAIIARVAIFEPVRQDEIDDFILNCAIIIVCACGARCGRGLGFCRRQGGASAGAQA